VAGPLRRPVGVRESMPRDAHVTHGALLQDHQAEPPGEDDHQAPGCCRVTASTPPDGAAGH